jgi:hypothetical protein
MKKSMHVHNINDHRKPSPCSGANARVNNYRYQLNRKYGKIEMYNERMDDDVLDDLELNGCNYYLNKEKYGNETAESE